MSESEIFFARIFGDTRITHRKHSTPGSSEGIALLSFLLGDDLAPTPAMRSALRFDLESKCPLTGEKRSSLFAALTLRSTPAPSSGASSVSSSSIICCKLRLRLLRVKYLCFVAAGFVEGTPAKSPSDTLCVSWRNRRGLPCARSTAVADATRSFRPFGESVCGRFWVDSTTLASDELAVMSRMRAGLVCAYCECKGDTLPIRIRRFGAVRKIKKYCIEKVRGFVG